MGWASASEYPIVVGRAMKKAGILHPDRVVVYMELCKALQHGDWDTEYECYGFDPALDQALVKLSGGTVEVSACDGLKWHSTEAAVTVDPDGTWRGWFELGGSNHKAYAKSRDKLLDRLEASLQKLIGP